MATKRALRGAIGISLLLLCREAAWATDPPHSEPKNPQVCTACHVAHSSAGVALTTVSGNANLCMSCHTTGGTASNKPFSGTMQAVPGASGSSHRWDGGMPAVSSPSNTYGLRAASNVTTTLIRNALNQFGGISVCSVCHNPHSQASAAWDIFAGPYTGLMGGDSGAASSSGGPTTIIDATKASFWTANAWQNYYVRILSSVTAGNVGQVRLISSNTTTRLTVSSAYPAAIQPGDKYEIVGRHFQITPDDVNQMCEDCHYYRVQNHSQVEGFDPSYPANGTNMFSHPVGQPLNGNGKNYDRPAPLDVNGAAQSGARSAAGGESPDNAANNLVLDSGNAVRCLTCHKAHYGDSNGLSNGLP